MEVEDKVKINNEITSYKLYFCDHCGTKGPVKKVYLGVLFWCTSEKGVLILTLNGEKGVLFFFNQNKMLLPK